jgi:hypothetical protein
LRNFRDVMNLEHKKSLRFALLLLSTLLIVTASALAYSRIVYEKALGVGNTGGATTGSGTTAPTGTSFPLSTIAVLAFSALVISISLFAFLREASKHVRKASIGQGLPPTGPGPTPSREEEWEEARPKKEDDEDNMKIFMDILDPEQKKSATTP